MSEKKNFVLRISQETYDLLEAWANDEFRSVNGQIEYLIQQSLLESGRKKKSKSQSVPPVSGKPKT